MINEKYLTEKECCQMAIDVQNACNIGGVSLSYHEVLISLRNNYGWSYKLSDHPAVILFHDKFEDMLRVPISERTEKYGEACSKCMDIIKAVP